jgi:hypothetical protein
MESEKKFITSDINLSAFLTLNKQPVNFQIQCGRVLFTFTASDKLYSLINDFNADKLTPVTAYVENLKALRGQMLALRGSK